MIQSFKDKATEDVFNGIASKPARKVCPQSLWRVAGRKLDQLDSVSSLDELKIFPGNSPEPSLGDRSDGYSIRINQQCCICFKWSDSGPFDVEITDYH